MEHDIFFSISQTPDADGHIPNELTMMKNYFQQLECADGLGFGVGWIAQAHLSTETQKSNSKPFMSICRSPAMTMLVTKVALSECCNRQT